MPYATDFVCTYHIYDNCDSDDYDEDDNNILYQMQFLQAFGLREYDTAKIDEILSELSTKINSDDRLCHVIMQHPLLKSPDTKTAACADILPFMFTYNSFYAFHKCIIDLYDNDRCDDGDDDDCNAAAAADDSGEMKIGNDCSSSSSSSRKRDGSGKVSNENLEALLKTYSTFASD